MLNVKKLCGKTSQEIKTELLFYVASFLAAGEEIFAISSDNDAKEAGKNKSIESAKRILKELKKVGRIQFFVSAHEGGATMEKEYLENKYPGILEECDSGVQLIIRI